MRKAIALFILLPITWTAIAQLCPGGGTTFANAVLWNPSAITGCTSGTSCTGGTTFDNRAACEPTVTIDACAPVPSCGTLANMGSDLWFRFYATSPLITINIVQSISFVASIQAFSGGGTGCGSLTQIGCVVAGGPSTGIALNLSGLITGNLYYFRIFGTAGSASQRTGTFCFCGSAGMSNIILPVKLVSFTGMPKGRSVELEWMAANQENFSRFEVERSMNGADFKMIGTVSAKSMNASPVNYNFTDNIPEQGVNFYRLKQVDIDGKFEYSSVIKIEYTRAEGFSAVMNNPGKTLVIYSDKVGYADVYDMNGSRVLAYRIQKGNNSFSVNLSNGTYVVKWRENNIGQKIIVTR